MKPTYTPTNNNTLKKSVYNMLLADLKQSMNEVRAYMLDIDEHPDKLSLYNDLLDEIMALHTKDLAEEDPKEIQQKVIQRFEEWEKTFSPLTLEEKLTVCLYWKVAPMMLFSKTPKPKVIKEMLDYFIKGQEDYKRQLALVFNIHLLRMNQKGSSHLLPRTNLLVYGPTGTGKTLGIQTAAKLTGVPYMLIDCSSLVKQGIIGCSIGDYFTSMYQKCGENIEEMKKMVVVFDEFDKLFFYNKNEANGTYGAIVNELLPILDNDGHIRFNNELRLADKIINLPTRNMTFIFTGVFNGLENLLNDSNVGFNAISNDIKGKNAPLTEALIRFGVLPEIAGRIQQCTSVTPLTQQQLAEVLDSPFDSPFNNCRNYFHAHGIDAVLTDDGRDELARIAYERKLGARALSGILQQVLSDDMFSLPDFEDKLLTINRSYIQSHIS